MIIDKNRHWEQIFSESDSAYSVVQYYRDQSLGKLKIVPAVKDMIYVKLDRNHPDESIAGDDDAADATEQSQTVFRAAGRSIWTRGAANT